MTKEWPRANDQGPLDEGTRRSPVGHWVLDIGDSLVLGHWKLVILNKEFCMKTRIALILMAGLVLGADTKEAKKDTDLVQGTWQATELVRNGETVPKDEVAKFQLIIKGDKYVFKSDGDMEGTFKLDDAAKPKHIDVTPAGGEALKGIYSVTDKELKLCVAIGGDRPKEFAAKADSGCILMVMKKKD